MQLMLHAGLKVIPFELHHGRKLRTELTELVKDNKSYLSDWTTLDVSAPPEQVPKYVARNERGESTEHIIMARITKIACSTSHKSPKRSPVKPISGKFQYSYTFSEEENQKNLWRGNIMNNREVP